MRRFASFAASSTALAVTGPSAGPNRMATGSGSAAPASGAIVASAESDRLRPGRRMLFSVTLRLPGRARVGARRSTSIMRAMWSPGSSVGAAGVGSSVRECGVGRVASTTKGPVTRVMLSISLGAIHEHSSAGGSLLAMDLRVICGTMPPISSPLLVLFARIDKAGRGACRFVAQLEPRESGRQKPGVQEQAVHGVSIVIQRRPHCSAT